MNKKNIKYGESYNVGKESFGIPFTENYGSGTVLGGQPKSHITQNGEVLGVEPRKTTNEKITNYLKELTEQLIEKNNNYGDSLQNPKSTFQKNKMDGLLGRIDDKLNRIKSVGINDKTEDTIGDLIGYLVHLKIMMNDEK